MPKELSNYKTHVAEKYVTKPEMKDLTERLERQMQKGFDRIYNVLNNKRDAP